MKRKFQLTLLITGCFLIATSCKFNNKTARNAFDVSAADSLSYTLFSTDTTDQSCLERFIHCPTVRINYPVFNTPDSLLNAYLNRQIKQWLLTNDEPDKADNRDISGFIGAFFEESRAMKKTGDYDDESSAWEKEKTVSVVSKNGHYLSLSFHQYGYMGGVHPNYITLFKNYNLLARKEIKAADVFNLNDTALLKLGEKYFRRDNEIPDTTSLADAGFFIFGEGEDFEDGPAYGRFHFNDNFALTKDGIEFFYNSYEIGPYAVGTPNFTIPYKHITPFLKLTIW